MDINWKAGLRICRFFNSYNDHPETMGKFGKGITNTNGENLLEFARSNRLILCVSSVNQSSVSLWCDQREATSSSDHSMVKGGVSLGVICFKSCLVVFLFCVLYMDERYVFGGQ